MPDLLNLHPEVRRRAERLVRYLRQQGYDVTVTSGYRSPKEQEKLYRDYAACQGAKKGFCIPAARPGRSTHQYGLAIDLVTDAPPEAREEYARQSGLVYAGASDPVHYDVFGNARWVQILAAAGVA